MISEETIKAGLEKVGIYDDLQHKLSKIGIRFYLYIHHNYIYIYKGTIVLAPTLAHNCNLYLNDRTRLKIIFILFEWH